VELLSRDQPELKILDAGSGVGKFCFVGSVLSRARFCGVEHRPHFIDLCQALLQQYRLSRVSFLNMDLAALDWTQFQGIYLYNPFQEYKTQYQKIDTSIPLDAVDFNRYVQLTREKLKQMPLGTQVVTYHGFGGQFPSSYVRTTQEFCFRGVLECWKKERK
jgi:predicted RNA methylase